MVRRTEWSDAVKRRVGVATRYRVHESGLEPFGGGQRRQDPAQGAGQHRLAGAGRSDEEHVFDAEAAARARIAGVADLGGLADVDLVIEAATEDPLAKAEIFARLGEVTGPEVVLASNTSSIPIATLAAASGRPASVVGMHFFNPVPVMPLIELTPAASTSDETYRLVDAFGPRRVFWGNDLRDLSHHCSWGKEKLGPETSFSGQYAASLYNPAADVS